MTTPLLPVYLLVDLADTGVPAGKEELLNHDVDALVDWLGSDPTLVEQVRVCVLGFTSEVIYDLPMTAPADIGRLPPMPVGGPRSYAAVLAEVRRRVGTELAELEMDLPIAGPLVVLLTDGPPAPDDQWEPALRELVDNPRQLTLMPVWWADSRVPGLPAYPVGVGHRRAVPGAGGLLRVVESLIRSHLSQPDARVEHVHDGHERDAHARAEHVHDGHERDGRARDGYGATTRAGRTPPGPRPAGVRGAAPVPPPRPAAEPEWVGDFQPYAVGHPGQAAVVRPAPDPGEWDRRDTVLDGVCLRDATGEPALELRAASVRGLSHRFYGTVRQDDYAFRCTADQRYLVAVVSDGVSNSRLSHKAANLVARVGAAEVARMLDQRPPEDLDWPELLRQLSDRVVLLAEKLVEPPPDGGRPGYGDVARHLAATALFAVVGLRRVDGATPVCLFAVGDSSAWVLRQGVRWEPQQPVKNADSVIATASTDAVPVKRSDFDPPVTTLLHAGDVLVLMTDGVGDPLGDGVGTVGRFLAGMWARPPAPLAFAAQVDFARRSQDDDRTALAVWPE
ncbi:protein phosphatase 2C domain-containing protein [Micromonospora sp. WMMD882]|uniref:protein phosphatase 2C domain-containing protein n=1 Tax=Micromonospora sp. WMMD882 TaxID=3015151 RepID=UPI00248ADC46|nr:protein phosphatase 2C domain-containing protein [Micromonospora sp. WMMD882]WBB80602.1 protein phosphatase 2C domain-containing protein [Micromonospora sp. WMMD882]